jgi:hypothetical protein
MVFLVSVPYPVQNEQYVPFEDTKEMEIINLKERPTIYTSRKIEQRFFICAQIAGLFASFLVYV